MENLLHAKSGAAHTDNVDNCEQIIDEPPVLPAFRTAGRRVKSCSDGNGCLICRAADLLRFLALLGESL